MIKKIFFVFLCCLQPLQSEIVFKKGKLISPQFVSHKSYAELVEAYKKAVNQKNYKEASYLYKVIADNHSRLDFLLSSNEDLFMKAVLAYYQSEWDLALKYLEKYLACSKFGSILYFKESYHFKYAIAEEFRMGKKRRLLGQHYLPKCVFSSDDALEIYDEIISILPNDSIAISAVFSRGKLLSAMEDYEGAIDSFKNIIQDHPSHALARDSYFAIAAIFLKQSEQRTSNPYLLDLAEVNFRRYRQAYPNDPDSYEHFVRQISQMKENHALGLSEIGQLYERKKMPLSAAVYYYNAIQKYPDTENAKFCKRKLDLLKKSVKDLDEIFEETSKQS